MRDFVIGAALAIVLCLPVTAAAIAFDADRIVIDGDVTIETNEAISFVAPKPTDAGAEPPATGGNGEVTVTVADIAGHGLEAYPVTAVIPYAKGVQTGCSGPQAAVMNQWLDGSVRHCAVTWLASAGAQKPTASKAKVVVDQAADGTISIGTGPLTFTIPTTPFRLVGTAWYGDQAVLSGVGGFVDDQEDFHRTDVTVEVEESGPVRATVKACAPTLYDETNGVTHGWCVRIYAYAGKPWIDIDYQLQNSAKVPRSMPLLFERAGLRFAVPNATAAAVLVTDGTSREACMIAAGAATVMLRHCWERWPSGVSVDEGLLTVDMWPDVEGKHQIWDMQHTVREARIIFGPATAEDYDRFTFPPVAIIPGDRYAATRATISGYGGMLPRPLSSSAPKASRPYNDKGPLGKVWREPGHAYYQLGAFFMNHEGARLWHACETGAVPPGGFEGLRRNDAGYTALWRLRVRMDLNRRPQWLAGYTYADDWPRLKPGEPPYCGGYWRENDKSGRKGLAQNVGKPPYAARDDQHGWHYPIEEVYWLTADPWIKDWYEFIAEFRKPHMTGEVEFFNKWGRGGGHMLSNALQAWRVTGDRELLGMIAGWVTRQVPTILHPKYGGRGFGGGEGFKTGYIERSVIDAWYELEGAGQDYAREMIWNFIGAIADGNLNYYNFPYFLPPKDMAAGVIGKSSGSGETMIDPQAWYFWQTGRQELYEHLLKYRAQQLPGGKKPYRNHKSWHGYLGRFTPWMEARLAQRDFTPPPPPTITRDGDRIAVQAVGRVSVRCGGKPIAVTYSKHPVTAAFRIVS